MVDVTSPPMTTVARGRWTSAPALVASAIGTNPKEATIAVINTGRSRVFAPVARGLPRRRVLAVSSEPRMTEGPRH